MSEDETVTPRQRDRCLRLLREAAPAAADTSREWAALRDLVRAEGELREQLGRPAELLDYDGLDAGPLPELAGHTVIRELGRGGMGVVYEAAQHDPPRPVAVKTMRAGGPRDAGRFRAEVEALAGLRHPNVVRIYEVGTCSAGEPYFTMELIPGGSLAEAVGGRPVPPRPAAEWAAAVADALHAAHENGVVHRDLKPANVLIDRDTAEADPPPASALRVGDFGLAKRLDADGVTSAGAILGTPGYVAPEQVAGGEVGPAVDIHAVGVMLYEWLTGRPPFAAPTPAEAFYRVVHEDPLSPRAVQPGTPRDLDTVCRQCLRKDPARRYPSAAALAADLRRYLAGEPVLARPPGPARRAAKWARRHPAAVTLCAAVLAAAGALFGVWLDFTARLKSERDAAEASRARAEQANVEMAVDRAFNRAEGGEPADGLLWFARALADAERLEGSRPTAELIRWNLGAWPASLHRLEATHAGPAKLESLAVAADGQTVALGGAGTVRFWHRGGKPVDAASGGVESVAFGPDGVAVAGDGAGRVSFLDPETGRSTRPPLRLDGAVLSVAFSPDGRTLLTAGEDAKARLWDYPSLKPRRALTGHGRDVTAAAFSRDGSRVVTGSKDRTCRVWDAATGACLAADIRQPEGMTTVTTVSFTPDGGGLLVGYVSGLLTRWVESDDGTYVQGGRTLMLGGSVRRAEYSPDGRVIMVAGGDRHVRLFDAAGLRPAGGPMRHPAPVHAAAFGPDGKTVIAGSRDGSVRAWRLAGPAPVRSRALREVTRLASTPDGTGLLFGLRHGGVLMRRPSGSVSWMTQLGGTKHRGDVCDAAVSPGGRFAATAGLDGTVIVRDAATGEARGRPLTVAPEAGPVCLAFAPDGNTLLAGDRRGAIVKIDPSRAAVTGEFPRQPGYVRAIAVDGETGRLAVGLFSGRVRFLRWPGGTAWADPLDAQGEMAALALSPGGRYVAVAGQDGVAGVFDPSSGERVGRPMRHERAVNAVRFHPSAPLLLTASRDRTARLWHVGTGRPVGPAVAHPHGVVDAVFTPDGLHVWTVGSFTRARWPVPEPETAPPDDARRAAGRLTGMHIAEDGAVRAR